MKEAYNYEDGFGEKLAITINPSNVLLTTHDTVVTHLSMPEFEKLSEFVKSAMKNIE